MRWYGSKYGNKKTEVDGITFDSKKEAHRYEVLRFYEENGLISDLEMQVKYELIPSQRGEIRNERAVYYVADFVYIQDGETIIEDVKGHRTELYKLKRKLMKYIYGVEIRET